MSRYGSRTRDTGSALSSRVGQWGRASIIKSIQQGSIDLNNVTSNTATITAVNLSNAVLFSNAFNTAYGASQSDIVFPSITLTNATTVTAIRTTGNATAMPVLFTVLEFQPGIVKSVQYGNTGSSTTITTVDPNKAIALPLGQVSTLVGTVVGTEFRSLKLNNATSVTVAGAGGGAVSFVVVEFY